MEHKTHNFPPYLFPLIRNDQLAVATFNPDLEEAWPELSEVFTSKKITTPIIYSDPSYQIEPLFQLVCKKHTVPAIAGPIKNMPLTRMILQATRPDILITQPNHAHTLLLELAAKKESVPFQTLFLFDYDHSFDLDLLEQLLPQATIHYTTHPLL